MYDGGTLKELAETLTKGSDGAENRRWSWGEAVRDEVSSERSF